MMELFVLFGRFWTAREIFFWYHWAPKVVKKRAHSWGSPDVIAAAQLRKKETDRYGHMRRR